MARYPLAAGERTHLSEQMLKSWPMAALLPGTRAIIDATSSTCVSEVHCMAAAHGRHPIPNSPRHCWLLRGEVSTHLDAGLGDGNGPVPKDAVHEPLLVVLARVGAVDVQRPEDGEGQAVLLRRRGRFSGTMPQRGGVQGVLVFALRYSSTKKWFFSDRASPSNAQGSILLACKVQPRSLAPMSDSFRPADVSCSPCTSRPRRRRRSA